MLETQFNIIINDKIIIINFILKKITFINFFVIE